jgi:ADP-ribosylglycohydrolase
VSGDGRAERFAGCLVGQAVGDAMGFIVEGDRRVVCSSFVELSLRPRRLAGYVRGPFPIGQYSDDTQLARELVLSLIERRGFEPADYAARIAALFTEERIVGRGRATEAAAFRLADGVPWDEAGTPPPSAGNGSAMRAAPVGLFFADDPAALVRAAHDQSRITHRDPRCSAGSIAIAGATAIAVAEDRIDPRALCARLAGWVRAFDPELAAALAELPSRIADAPERAASWARRIGVSGEYDDVWDGISPYVTQSVLFSLYAFLRSTDDYWSAICTAIEVGGDVDTTAAMTGAIAGAHLGLSGIPREAYELLNDRGEWRCDDLARIAHTLHDVRARPDAPRGAD